MDINAVYSGANVGTDLAGIGQVIGVYGKAINIQLSKNLCFSIVNTLVDRAPNRVGLSDEDFSRLPVEVGDVVRVTNEAIYHRKLTIHIPLQTRRFLAMPPITVGDFAPLVLRGVLAQTKGPSHTYLNATSGDKFDQYIAEKIKFFSRDLDEGWRLLGLGKGLTPTGDDVLTGFTAAASRTGMLDQEWFADLLLKARSLTNPLSYTALYYAGSGVVQEYLEEVLTALDGPAESLRVKALRLVENVGSTSGSDLLLGVLVFCERICGNKRMRSYAESAS